MNPYSPETKENPYTAKYLKAIHEAVEKTVRLCNLDPERPPEMMPPGLLVEVTNGINAASLALQRTATLGDTDATTARVCELFIQDNLRELLNEDDEIVAKGHASRLAHIYPSAWKPRKSMHIYSVAELVAALTGRALTDGLQEEVRATVVRLKPNMAFYYHNGASKFKPPGTLDRHLKCHRGMGLHRTPNAQERKQERIEEQKLLEVNRLREASRTPIPPPDREIVIRMMSSWLKNESLLNADGSFIIGTAQPIAFGILRRVYRAQMKIHRDVNYARVEEAALVSLIQELEPHNAFHEGEARLNSAPAPGFVRDSMSSTELTDPRSEGEESAA